MLLDDLIALLCDAILWLAGQALELALMLLSAAMMLFVLTGRGFYWLLGRKPYREIVFLTGVTFWGVIGAIAFIVSAYWS
jgi:hypothetical protein